MGTVISNLKARFGVDTTDFKKGLKDGEKATEDFKGAAGGTLDEFASMFGVNMQGVASAIGTANKSLNFMGQSFKAAKTGSEVFAVGLKMLKFALVATGIGALVVVLGSVIAYFQKSGEGSDKFAKILLQMKSVLNNVVERLVAFGRGIVDIFSGRFAQGAERMASAFKGMGTEIKEDWKAAGDLSDRIEALEDKDISLINTLEERRAKAAELRLQAKEEITDMQKKLSLMDQVAALYKSVYSDQIGVERERLSIMKEQFALQTTDPTDEQNRTIAEQEAKINSLLREQAEQLKGLIRERNSASKIVAEELALEKLKSEEIAIQKADISNLKLPDLSALAQALAPLKELQKTIHTVSLDISNALNEAMVNLGVTMAEFAGNLLIGQANMKDFGALIGAALGDFAITVGKMAIEMGVTALAVHLVFANPMAAIAAGMALVAAGTAMKGSLSKAGGGSTATLGGGGGVVYDTRKTGAAQQSGQQSALPNKVVFEISGKNLVGVLNMENVRTNIVT